MPLIHPGPSTYFSCGHHVVVIVVVIAVVVVVVIAPIGNCIFYMSSKFQGVASSYDHNDYFEDYSPVLFPVCALYLCLLAMLIFVRLPLFICHVIRTQASAHTRCLFTRTHRHAFSFIETGFLGL